MSTFTHDPAVWTRSSLASEAEGYVVRLTDADREAIVTTVRNLRAAGAPGVPVDARAATRTRWPCCTAATTITCSAKKPTERHP